MNQTPPLAPTLFDTHAHLDAPEFRADLEAVVQRAKANGVAEIVTVGTDVESTKRAIEIAAAHAGVYASVGFHPNESARFRAEDEQALRDLCREREVVAVGETGLDYYRDHAPRPAQKELFLRHLEMAAETGLPLILHQRQAAHDCLALLAEFAGRVRGVAHCFSADEAVGRKLLDLGFFISLAGPVSFPNAGQLKRIARIVPADRLLVETDCPWLAPQPVRGRRNEPAFVRYTLNAIAALRGVAAEELARQTTENARRLFLRRERQGEPPQVL